MKRFSEQLHTKSQTVKLRAAEKRELRERVVSYMEYHPLPAELKSTKKVTDLGSTSVISEPFKTFKIPFNTLIKTSLSFAVLVAVVIPVVAERAVPGDVLYAVKVQFNEELRGTLTFDSFQKVEWETERLNRRIAEARLLASEGRLTAEAEADVAEAVRTHSANAQREIAELRTEDEDAATIASISLSSTLDAQSSSFKVEDSAETGADFEAVPINLIANAIDESRVSQEEANASSTPPAYGKLMARVEQNTTRIYELIASLKTIVAPEELMDVTRRAVDIDRAVQGAIDISVSNEAEARTQLVEVLQRTQRLVVYITELQVTNTVDIETIVPVVLTEEEKSDKINRLTNEIEEKTQVLEEQVPLLEEIIEDEGVIEKVVAAQTQITRNLARLASTTDYVASIALAKETIGLVDDALLLIEVSSVVKEETLPEVVLPEETSTSSATSSEEVIEVTEEVVVEEVLVEETEEELANETPDQVTDDVDTL